MLHFRFEAERCKVDDCLRAGGVIWTCDQPSQPASPVKAFCYRQGRQFAVSGADEILPLLLQLQDLGLAVGLQTVPERGVCARGSPPLLVAIASHARVRLPARIPESLRTRRTA